MMWLKALPLGIKLGLGCLICIFATILFVWITGLEREDDRTNQQIGATVERSEAVQAGMDNARKANDAEQVIRRDPVARSSGCVRYSRTPQNCDRHELPVVQGN